MGLLDIPSEIIDVILDLSLPLGIEGLALTCKALHGRAKPQIQRHNALKRKWRRTTNYDTPRREDTLQILYEMSRDPLVADYIEVLDLWDRRDEEESEGEGDVAGEEAKSDVYDFRADKVAMAKVKETIAESAIFTYAEMMIDEWWAQILNEDSKGVGTDEMWRAALTLIVSLPNLRVLRLSPDWNTFEPHWNNQYEEVVPALVGIIKAANTNNGREKPLSKLKTILPFMRDGYEEKAGLQCLQPFMTLNSLTELYLVSAVAVDDGYSGIPFEWRSLGIASSLTRLELASSCMDSDGLASLVAHTPNLAIFKYSHETKYHGCQHDWNPGTIIEALTRYCRNSITEVALTIDELYGAIINGTSSFLSLPRLEKLEVDVHIFCGPPVESGQRLGEDAFLPEGARPWIKTDIPCIGSMLPSNIKEVQINTGYPDPEPDEEALEALLKNLREQRSERLHRLEKVVIRQYSGRSAQILVERHGATLETFNDDTQEMRSRSNMPEWKRNFEQRVAELAT